MVALIVQVVSVTSRLRHVQFSPASPEAGELAQAVTHSAQLGGKRFPRVLEVPTQGERDAPETVLVAHPPHLTQQDTIWMPPSPTAQAPRRTVLLMWAQESTHSLTTMYRNMHQSNAILFSAQRISATRGFVTPGAGAGEGKRDAHTVLVEV